ncbi:coiled-coil domain-containing protein 63 [Melospiza melodia melodia]|uniref:coiled-coil domain-containing protein 63 n=1 Tax=Melospiza melodia melodia TaxID=1914991 RepID=UPI002FCF5C1C
MGHHPHSTVVMLPWQPWNLGQYRRREASADLDITEKEKEYRAKVEIRHLQTHFHHEAYKRKFFDAEIWRQMQAQEREIADLRQEHGHVTATLKQLYSPSSMVFVNRNRMKVRNLMQTSMQNDALIKERKAQLADLAKQVLELEKKIANQRESNWKELGARTRKQLHKTIELLEMRLRHVRKHFGGFWRTFAGSHRGLAPFWSGQSTWCKRVTVCYNAVVARNNKLREETASLQIQKASFDNLYWKLERSLVLQNKLLNAAIEQATEDYDQWMEDLGRISDIRDVRYRETIQYNIRLLERKCALHQESRLKNFFLSKCADLSVLKEQAKAREAFEAAERAKASQKESYEVAYKRLLELSDGNIDDFLEDFLEKDRRFFILFNFAIRLNVNNESLRQRIEAVQAAILGQGGFVLSRVSFTTARIQPHREGEGDAKEQPKLNSAAFWELNVSQCCHRDDMEAMTTEREKAETTQTQVLQELKAKIAETTKEANKYENKYKESSQLLGQIQSRIETLLKEMDCDTTKIVKPLGDSLVPVFGPVESKVKEFLMRESLLRYTSLDRSQRAQGFVSPLREASSHLWTMDRAKLCPHPPDLEESADPRTAEEPLGREELRELVIQRQQEEVSRPPSAGKKRRKFTSPGASGSPSGSKTPAGN